MSEAGTPLVRRHRSKWRQSVIVCRKCSKKVRGGFGKKGRTALAELLKDEFGGKGRRAEIGVIEAPCFKLCPKRAVTVALGTEPGVLFEIPEGMDPAGIVATLGLRPTPRSGN